MNNGTKKRRIFNTGEEMRIAGVDPGKKGAIVVVSCDAPEGFFYRLKYNKAKHLDDDLLRFLEQAAPDQIVLEKVQGRGGFNATSTFNFGFACGELNALLRYWASVRSASMHYVAPQTWQKVCHEGIADGLNPKERSAVAYERLFPHSPGKTPKQKRTDDNVIDALLLATYGVIRFGGGLLRRWELSHCLGTIDDESGGNVLPIIRRSKP